VLPMRRIVRGISRVYRGEKPEAEGMAREALVRARRFQHPDCEEK